MLLLSPQQCAYLPVSKGYAFIPARNLFFKIITTPHAILSFDKYQQKTKQAELLENTNALPVLSPSPKRKFYVWFYFYSFIHFPLVKSGISTTAPPF